MQFEDPDRTSTEDFVNPNITKVEMPIEGVPNQLYSHGMRQYQQWDEINKYFALTSKRDKETDKVAKDLYFSDTNIEKYLTKIGGGRVVRWSWVNFQFRGVLQFWLQ